MKFILGVGVLGIVFALIAIFMSQADILCQLIRIADALEKTQTPPDRLDNPEGEITQTD